MTLDLAAANAEAKGAIAGQPEALVKIDRLTKRYAMTTVVDGVSFDIRRGEVHAIVGENGAGKSTVARLLAGFAAPTSGTILIDGEEVTHFTVQEAEKMGVILIHQELALAEHLTVVQNMFLGHELHRGPLLSIREMSRRAGEMLGRLGRAISPTQTVSDLPVAEKQMVEIAKALLRDAKLIIMDEPTAVLTPRESASLFAQIERLRSENISVVFVSHRLDEVKRIADRVTILRDGKYQGTWPVDALSIQQIANLMVGRELNEIYPAKSQGGATSGALRVRDYLGETSKKPVNFEAGFGEILGVAGLIGSGRTELFESLVGLRPQRGGEIMLRGKPFHAASYHDALAAGFVYITEDRKGRGLLLGETIAVNVCLLDQIISGARLVDTSKQAEALEWATRQFDVEAPYPKVRVGRLSGGNQQKVLLAKSLLNNPEIVIVDEPTRGIDVGARAQIYQMLRRLADEGKAIIVISSDLQEVIGLSDRVMVMRDNAVAGFLAGAEVAEQNIVQLATGVGAGSEDAS